MVGGTVYNPNFPGGGGGRRIKSLGLSLATEQFPGHPRIHEAGGREGVTELTTQTTIIIDLIKHDSQWVYG